MEYFYLVSQIIQKERWRIEEEEVELLRQVVQARSASSSWCCSVRVSLLVCEILALALSSLLTQGSCVEVCVSGSVPPSGVTEQGSNRPDIIAFCTWRRVPACMVVRHTTCTPSWAVIVHLSLSFNTFKERARSGLNCAEDVWSMWHQFFVHKRTTSPQGRVDRRAAHANVTVCTCMLT
jgi:hypothetical protein